MRKIFLTLGITFLALAAVVGSACKKDAGNSNNTNSPSSTPTPASTPKNSGTSTPSETFKTFYNALKNKDVAALKTVLPKKTLDEMAEEAKKKNKSLDDFLRDEVVADMSHDLPATIPETRNEQIDGDKASLEYMEKGEWKTGHMVKEDGSWKIS